MTECLAKAVRGRKGLFELLRQGIIVHDWGRDGAGMTQRCSSFLTYGQIRKQRVVGNLGGL